MEIRTTDGKGTVVLDGRVVGEGSFEGAIDAGPHSLEVRRVGFTSHSRTIELRPGQLYVETVQLALDAAEPEPVLNRTRVLSGLYGGLELAAMFLPGGSGATLETGCDRLGASECDSPTPWGPLLGAYFGYAFDPIGLELFAAGLADYTMPTARFDGRLGSELNPLVAAPARSEEFLIFRAGLVAAIRLRATVDFEVVRLAFAGGIGLSYRKMWMRREGQAEDGTDAKSDFVPDPVEYLSPGLSLQLALGLPVSTVTQLSLGLAFWGETARTDARTTPDDVMLVSDSGSSLPRPEHTPAYDLARGPQLYLGPVLGLQFGP